MEYSASSQKKNVNAVNAEGARSNGSNSFEYTGNMSLTVKGNATGTEYRFNHRGIRRSIDPRDIPGIMSIPVLKRLQD